MRRGYETYTTARAAVTACVLCAGLPALLALGSMFPVLGVGLIALTVMPALLMIVGLTAGLIPLGLCLIITLAALAFAGGAPVAGFGALYLAPMTAVYVFCLHRNIPFFRSCGLVAGALFLSQACIWLLLQRITGNAVYERAGILAAYAVSDLPYRDQLLLNLVSMGLLQVPSSMRETAIITAGSTYQLSGDVVVELMLQVRSWAEQLVRAFVPSSLITGSGLSALLGLGLGVRWGRRAAQTRAYRREEALQDIPDLDMPPLREWHLPRPWGLRVALLAVGYPLMQRSSGGMQLLGTMLWQAFFLCFAVQGLAAMNYAQHRRGTGRSWRIAVPVLALLFRFMQIALLVVGLIDQVTNTRGLRPPLRPRDEEDE